MLDVIMNHGIWRILMSLPQNNPLLYALKEDLFTYLGRTDDMVDSYYESEESTPWYRPFYDQPGDYDYD